MELLLDVAQRYHPEMRRWSLHEETEEGSRVLTDHQSGDFVEIPRYSFALFPGGTPSVVSYELMSLLAPPNPRIIVPEVQSRGQIDEFAERVNKLIGSRVGAKIIVEGPNREYIYLDYPVDYPYLLTGEQGGQIGMTDEYGTGPRSRVRIVQGDTLFSYTYPREVDVKSSRDSGGIDYMPTSVVSSTLGVPAVESFDLSGDYLTEDWTSLWPPPPKPVEGPFYTLREYAKAAGIEYYTAEYRYNRGLLPGARPHKMHGYPLIPQSLVTKGNE